MRVLRVETAEGIGPYRDSVFYSEPRASYATMDTAGRHPLPNEDGVEMDYWQHNDNLLFGFESAQQCKSWFFVEDDDARLLTEKNLLVVEYEVPTEHVMIGRRQLVFDLTRSAQLRQMTPLEFAKEMA